MTDKHMDYEWEASTIIMAHTEAMLYGGNYEPDNADELYEHMVEECAYILTTKLLSKEYTPMQYNAIRNKLGYQLWDIFHGE